ncbi:MAG: DUF3344 domain-containing protein [Candidatus Helarchaeota archaeon]
MKLKNYKIITLCLSIALIVSTTFLVIQLIPSESIHLELKTVSTDAYLDKYLFSNYPYQLQVQVTNNGPTALGTGFTVELFLNDTYLAQASCLELGAGETITLNYTWIPRLEGHYNLRATIEGPNLAVTNNDLTTQLDVYNESLNGYGSGHPFATYCTGLINGTVDYTIGNSTYKSGVKQNESYYVYFNLSDLNLQGNVELARLYIYYTWYYGANPQPDLLVQLNKSPAIWSVYTLSNSYVDQKGFGSYNLPSGTLCYNVTSALVTTDTLLILNVTNIDDTLHPTYDYGKVSIYGAGLLVVMKDTTLPRIQYWINEGCDLLVARYAAPQYQPTYYPFAMSTYSRPGSSNPIANATLISVVLGGDGGHNSLIFNGHEWSGIYNITGSNIAVATTDVSGVMSTTSNNIAYLVDQWDVSNNGMTPSNAFLFVEY